MTKIWTFLLCTAFVFCSSEPFAQNNSKAGASGHPAWSNQGNIYEVNIRQYTSAGTFNAFAPNLNRLKNMGVKTLWFMPINPISKVDRKGTMGSYYAVSDYTAVNPEFGTLRDWKRLVKNIHLQGMKVIIDWVPNHTGADHRWLTQHPNFYVKDSSGKAAIPYDWADTRQLDYSNMEMQDSMIAAMKYWLDSTGIDGFRQDVAWNVPADFWSRCISTLKQAYPQAYFLAEGDKPYLLTSGFDAFYPWEMFHKMVDVAAGKSPAFALDSIKAQYDKAYPADAQILYFTSNHDENSWNKSDFGTFPGAAHAPFAVLTQTYAQSVPLIYSGQEEPVLRALAFFEKDPIRFREYKRATFYKTLLQLRSNNPALAADAAFKKFSPGDKKYVYAYTREKAGKKVAVILNLSNKEQTIKIKDKSLWGEPFNVFMGSKEPVSGKEWKLEPWGYVVYVYDEVK